VENDLAMSSALLIIGAAMLALPVYQNKRARKSAMQFKNPLQTLSDRQFRLEFRFEKGDIPRLLQALAWPEFVTLENCSKIPGEVCLLLVLFRFSFPTTQNKMEIMFGMSGSLCTRAVKHGVQLLDA
jgi:hypothetical protein